MCPAGLTPASLQCQNTAIASGVITGGVVASAYVIGLAGVPPNALLCGDNTTIPPIGGVTWPYSACTVNP